MTFSFTKYSGCGNDFIVIDDRTLTFPQSSPGVVRCLCQRRTGIGADGVILLQNSAEADFRMRIFNADGGEAEMCGNGVRCLMKFIQEEIDASNEVLQIQTEAGIVDLKVTKEGKISASMEPPEKIEWNLRIDVDGIDYTLHYMVVGVPHLVMFVDDLDSFDLNTVGKKLRNHPRFAPLGANVNVATLKSNGELHNRTYERGVEEETLACGTGCAAVAVAAKKLCAVQSPVEIHTRSKETLHYSFEFLESEIYKICMTGSSDRVFHGAFTLSS